MRRRRRDFAASPAGIAVCAAAVDRNHDRLRLLALLCCAAALILAPGCRSTGGSFHMDSNSGAPWFGLNLSLPKKSADRKTLETISDKNSDSAVAATTDLRVPEPPSRKRSLLPRWLGGTEKSIPLPEDGLTAGEDRVIRLEAPRAEFQ